MSFESAAWFDQQDALENTAVFTDFDGTLAAIVANPDAAVPLPGVVDTLTQIARRTRTVAVISGRNLAFLEAFFPIQTGVSLSGLYGLQTRTGGQVREHPDVGAWRTVVAKAVSDARAQLPPSVRVEPKELALTLHYREAPDLQQDVEVWAKAYSNASGLVVAASRCSVELNLPIEVDKGVVVDTLLNDAGIVRACFLGDDRADIAAFEALDARRSATFSVCTVAVRGDETPDALCTMADLVVDGPAEAHGLLRSMLGQ